MTRALLSKQDIERAFAALDEELRDAGLTAALNLAGGAALAFLFADRASTRDVDACHVGDDVRAAAERVAARLGLEDRWLNDDVSAFVRTIGVGPVLFEGSALVVRSVALEQLLAMKLGASRDDQDVADAQALLERLVGSLPRQVGGDREHVWLSLAPYVPPGRESRARETFDDLWEAIDGSG